MPFIKGHKSGMTGLKHKDSTKKLIGKKLTGNNNGHWNGGKTIRHGYLFILNKNHPNCNAEGYVAKHRLVMEKHLGRHLKKHEHVHHINGIKTDNRIKNLLLTNRKQHIEFHREKMVNGIRKTSSKRRKRIIKYCINCNKKFEVSPCEDHVFCSYKCYHNSMIGKKWHNNFKKGELNVKKRKRT